jgi:hypothetical protein
MRLASGLGAKEHRPNWKFGLAVALGQDLKKAQTTLVAGGLKKDVIESDVHLPDGR